METNKKGHKSCVHPYEFHFDIKISKESSIPSFVYRQDGHELSYVIDERYCSTAFTKLQDLQSFHFLVKYLKIRI